MLDKWGLGTSMKISCYRKGPHATLGCGGLDAAKSMGLDMAKSMGLDAAKSWLRSLRNPSSWHFRPKVWENYNDYI